MFFYLEEVVYVVLVEEGYVEASPSCSSSSACSVNESFWLLGGRELDNQLYIGNVESPSCYVGCHQHLLLAALELAEVKLAIGLGDIAVENDKVFIIEVLDEVVGLHFGLGEDDRPAIWIVLLYNLPD